ncbi:MAG: MarR family transcriptional regulator [Acidimicrobiia bacterium]|nr:MarR family transcriptional regulator [Acidimicrobiia bacterium]
MADCSNLCEDPRIHQFGVALEAMGRVTRVLAHSLKEASGLSMSEFEGLLRVERSGGYVAMGELASQLTLTSGGVTRLIDRLASMGLMERKPCSDDRRVQWAVITDEGRARLHAAVAPHLEDLSAEWVGRMTAEELAIVTEVMDRLRDPVLEPEPVA